MSELLRVYAPEECGNDGYPYAWHRSIKNLIREHDGNRCRRCGHPYTKGDGEWSRCDEHCTHSNAPNGHVATARMFLNGIPRSMYEIFKFRPDDRVPVVIEARWRILTVHHLDNNKANCMWWNLVSLCQRDHLAVQRRVKMARPFPWPHTDWFKPYVAGYYAFRYRGESLTRPEVEARLDELLALGLKQAKEEWVMP